MAKKTYIVVFGFALMLGAAVLFLERCKPRDSSGKHVEATTTAEYVGDKTCITCHSKEFADWKKSDHYMAMLPANDSTILGDFNNVTYTANGVTSKFFRRDGKFFINTEGPDGVNHDFEVVYTPSTIPRCFSWWKNAGTQSELGCETKKMVPSISRTKNISRRLASLDKRRAKLEHNVRVLSFNKSSKKLFRRTG